jgi:hypothetical protein
VGRYVNGIYRNKFFLSVYIEERNPYIKEYANSERFEVFTAVKLLRSVFRLLVTANVVPNSPILVSLMMEAILFTKRQF